MTGVAPRRAPVKSKRKMTLPTAALPTDREKTANPAPLPWRKPTCRRIEALDARMSKARSAHDSVHLS